MFVNWAYRKYAARFYMIVVYRPMNMIKNVTTVGGRRQS